MIASDHPTGITPTSKQHLDTLMGVVRYSTSYRYCGKFARTLMTVTLTPRSDLDISVARRLLVTYGFEFWGFWILDL